MLFLKPVINPHEPLEHSVGMEKAFKNKEAGIKYKIQEQAKLTGKGHLRIELAQ